MRYRAFACVGLVGLALAAPGWAQTEIRPASSVNGAGVSVMVIKTPDGTVSLPAMSFVSDPDSGLYVIASNRIGMATNGTLSTEFNVTGQLLPAGFYVNWGTTAGTSGYGLRANSGNIEYKNEGGAWTAIPSAVTGVAWSRAGTIIAPVNAGDSVVADSFLRVGEATTYDGFLFTPPVKGANQFDGTLTSSDLTAARTWTLPNASGIVYVGAQSVIYGTVTAGALATQSVIAVTPQNDATPFTGTLTIPATTGISADRTWTLPDSSGTMLIAKYGGMYLYTGAAATVIGTAAEYYALAQMITGLQQGFTYIAGVGGGPGAAISAVSDATGGDINIVAPGTWVTGQPVTIHGTTNYDGAYLIKTGGTNTFVITKAYVATRTGVARGAASLKADVGSAGTYEVGFTCSAVAAASQTFHIEANKGVAPQDNVASKAQTSANSFYRALAGIGHFVIADGDMIWLSIYNDSGASNITTELINMTIKRIGS